MNLSEDWLTKLRQAIDRIRTRYDHIGRKTGAPFLAIVYPPGSETEVFQEWNTLTDSLCSGYTFREIDIMDVTMKESEKLGIQNIVSLLNDPMPGSPAESELGQIWITAIGKAVKEKAKQQCDGQRLIIVLKRLAALYPVTGPRAVMQSLWDSQQSILNGPVIIFIPGSLCEPRVYKFLNIIEEFMYRGDIM